MSAIIAFCGINCSECPAYLATQADDDVARAAVVEKWTVEHNAKGLTIEAINCDGCLAVGGKLFGHCSQCKIRACGLEHKLDNCAQCGEYESCKKLQEFFGFVPEAKTNLEKIRNAQ